jgi:hypothetical protein
MVNILLASIFVLVTSQGSETYKAILARALQRNTARTHLKGSRKYTAEHDELVKDVVENYNGHKSILRQSGISNQSLADLGIIKMSIGSFKARATTVARQEIVLIYQGSCRPFKVCVEATKWLNSLLEGNPSISPQEFC